MADVVAFIIAFLLPFVFFRLVGYLVPRRYIEDPFLTKLVGLRFHHYHYGIMLALAGAVWLVLFGESLTVIWLLGLGIGMVFDIFVVLLIKQNDGRRKQFELYARSFTWTLTLFLAIVLIILGLEFLYGR